MQRNQHIRRAEPVTNSDTIDLPGGNAMIYLGTGGDVTVILADDETDTPVLLAGLCPGFFHPIFVKRVMATGTVPTDIVAGYPARLRP